MNLEVLVLIITGFFIANTYYDNKYIEMFKNNKKYISMTLYGFIGISLYILIKRNPYRSKEMIKQASNVVKYMPVDKSSISMLEPVAEYFSPKNNNVNHYQERRLMNSGTKTTKRSVSETKKKYVASQQNWRCKHCTKQLPAWFEVDHVMKLEYGGSNAVENLEALCRDCHGRKTAMENL